MIKVLWLATAGGVKVLDVVVHPRDSRPQCVLEEDVADATTREVVRVALPEDVADPTARHDLEPPTVRTRG